MHTRSPTWFLHFWRILACLALVTSLWGCSSPYEIIPSSSILPTTAQEERDKALYAIPPDLRARLDAVIEKSGALAENAGANRQFVGQMLNPHERLQRELLKTVLVWAAEKPSEERLTLQTRQMQAVPQYEVVQYTAIEDAQQNAHVEFAKGVAVGVPIAAVPLGPVIADLAIELRALPKAGYYARVGRVCGEFISGVVQMGIGCAGISGGIGATSTGGGSVVGVPLVMGSYAILAIGASSALHAVNQASELWHEGLPPEPPPSQPEIRLLDKPKAAKPAQPAVDAKPAQPARPAKPAQPAAPAETRTTTHNRTTGETTSRTETGTTTTTRPRTEPAKLEPYNKGGGHHVPAKRAFEGTSGYDANKALAIPKTELKNLGIKHSEITGAQLRRYKEFAKNEKPLTWEVVAEIETAALVDARMDLKIARGTVTKAIQALKDAGVAAPIRIPWSK